MKSSNNQYWVALDHVRAMAALLVFVWHFTHGDSPTVARDFTPALFPFAIFDEGHTGVGLFMVLSGYLFAKLLDGKSIDYGRFFWNRAIRLFPLLALVMIIRGGLFWAAGNNPINFIYSLVVGIVKPTWPNGGWSVVVEIHFYILLPLILWLSRKDSRWLLAIVAIAVIGRSVYYELGGNVQDVAYWTIIGRIDQFVLGIFMFANRERLQRSWGLAALTLISFLMFYWWFDAIGGQCPEGQVCADRDKVWIVLTTIEGLAYAILIAFYDTNYVDKGGRMSTIIAKFGSYSYSIYLLHFFVYQGMIRVMRDHLYAGSNFYIILGFAFVGFALMYPLGWLSFHLIEKPSLRFRTKYVR